MLRTTSLLFVLLAVCFSAGFQESGAAEIKILAPTEDIPLAAESLHRIRWQADAAFPPQTNLSLSLSYLPLSPAGLSLHLCTTSRSLSHSLFLYLALSPISLNLSQ